MAISCGCVLLMQAVLEIVSEVRDVVALVKGAAVAAVAAAGAWFWAEKSPSTVRKMGLR